jgi:dipeptidyl aminopeptidase/acylaminoacyl peptidase
VDRLDRAVVEVKRAVIGALLCSAALAAVASAAPTRTLKLADLRQTTSVQNPQISPDGTHIAAYVTHRDYDKNKGVADLVLFDVRTHNSRKLVRAGISATVAWSPDGSSIAYLAASDNIPQIFLLPMNGGEPLKVTDEKNGVDDFAWRPDGAALAYTATPESPNAKDIEHHEDAFNVTEEPWTAQEAAPTDQLYVIDAKEGSKPRHIGNGKWNVGGGFAYAPDAKSIFVTRIIAGYQPNNESRHEIVRVDLGDGHISPIARLSMTQQDPFFSRDGKRLAFSFANPTFGAVSEVALSDPAGAHALWATKSLDRAIQGADFMPDDSLVVLAPNGTRTLLYHLGANGLVALPLGDLNATSVSIARNGTVAFTATNPTRGNDLYVLTPGAKVPVRLTDENRWLDGIALGRHETIIWHTRSGFTANGVLVYPPNYSAGKRYPLALLIHGGPTSSSNNSFGALADTLAAHGWFVFQPNYVGSDNEGTKYASAIVPHVSSVMGDSIEDGLAVLLKRNSIDPNKIAVSGWSAGGLATSWLITHDTRWVAAVDGAAVDDYPQIGAMTDSKDYVDQLLGPKPWANDKLLAIYKSESPLAYADRVKSPTLILSDAGDFRVPTPLSYEFYHSIRATGTPVKFVIWPVNGHFPSDPVRSEDVYRQWETWLATYL